jgi:hypothetical protein
MTKQVSSLVAWHTQKAAEAINQQQQQQGQLGAMHDEQLLVLPQTLLQLPRLQQTGHMQCAAPAADALCSSGSATLLQPMVSGSYSCPHYEQQQQLVTAGLQPMLDAVDASARQTGPLLQVADSATGVGYVLAADGCIDCSSSSLPGWESTWHQQQLLQQQQLLLQQQQLLHSYNMFFGTADNAADMSSAASVLAAHLTSAAAAAGNAAVPGSEDCCVMHTRQWTPEPPGLGRNADYVPLFNPAATSVLLAAPLTSAAAAAGDAAVCGSGDCVVVPPLQWTPEPPGLGRNADYVPLFNPAATSVLLAAPLTSAAAAAGSAAVPGSADCLVMQPLQWTPEPPGLDCSTDNVPGTSATGP